MRIVTQKIRQELPLNIIEMIWEFYNKSYQGVEQDDYQFFQIETINNKTTLKMWQEEPPAFKIKSIPHFKNCEVWVINDGNRKTMLFPSDY